MVAARLTPELEKRVARLARRTGQSKAAIMRAALVGHLEEVEDLLIATARLKRLDAGKSRSYSAADVKRELGLAI
jgi:RHH-type rel operon transcriptional repressor/antitoxin RelB